MRDELIDIAWNAGNEADNQCGAGFTVGMAEAVVDAILARLKQPSDAMIEAGVDASDNIEEAMYEREQSPEPEGLPDYDQGDCVKAAFRATIETLEAKHG